MAFLAGTQRQYAHADGIGAAVDMGPSCLVIDGCALDPGQAHELALILLEWSWSADASPSAGVMEPHRAPL